MKHWGWIIVFVVVLVGAFMYLTTISNECEEAGGQLVRGLGYDYQCISREDIIE